MDAQQIIRTSNNSYHSELPRHAKGVRCPVSLRAMPELECCQLPGIVHRSLKHEVMVVDEWHDNGPQDLVTVSLCIQNSNNQMQLCSLSMTNTSPYHSSPVAMGHFHNLDISNALTHATPCSLSAIFPVQRLIHVGNTSPKCCQMRTFAHSSW